MTIHSFSGIGIGTQHPKQIINSVSNADCPYSRFCNYCEYPEIHGYMKASNKKEIFEQKAKCPKRSFVFNSELFKNFEIINLTEIKRQNDDKVFAAVLNNIRFGRSIENAKYIFNGENITPSLADRLDVIHIYAANKECDKRNQEKLASIPGQEYTFFANDSFEVNKDCKYPYETPDEITEALNKNTIAPQILRLKETCRVMLIYNLNVQQGLCSGAIGTVTKIDRSKGIITVLFDNKNTGICNISRVDIVFEEPDGKLIRTQIPLIPAYGITVHKSQGMTLNKAIISMQNVFAQGQSYVSLSRLQSLKGIAFIKGYNPQKVFYNKEALHYYLSHGITE